MESNDSPEIPDKERHETSPASLRGVIAIANTNTNQSN